MPPHATVDQAGDASATAAVRPTLILASTSRYRRELLARLRLPFDVISPGVGEGALADEGPADLARRLSRAKAEAVALLHPDAVVIGSDQVCEVGGEAIGKPGTHERAVQQLQRLSGQRAVFHTSVCVMRRSIGYESHAAAPVVVRFRVLRAPEIEHYLRTEQPYDCAGSAKSETLGIALLDAIESDDPTALVGLPLIRTARMLREAGIDPLRP
ncbi:MAG: septum formation protein Maf [Rubrivivax sp.]|nr:septum formation protein Maf [Rubrivivax sp.]